MAKRRSAARPKSDRRARGTAVPPVFQALEQRLLLDAKWTIMVYVDGDNNLEGAAITDFLEMAKVGSNADVKVVVEFDRSPESDDWYGYSADYDDWADTRRGLVWPNDEPNKLWGESIGEANMGDPTTLTEFVNWAQEEYPAENYAVVLWDHGDGYKGVCWDDTSGDTERLTPAELGQAVAGFSDPVQLIGFDACLMSMMEVAYQVWDQAQVFVGSQETESSDGWLYDQILTDLTANPGWTPAELGTEIVASFKELYNVPGALDTLSAIDLTRLGGSGGAAAALTAFTDVAMHSSDADAMGELWWDTSFFGANDRTLSDYTDLGTFLDLVANSDVISPEVRFAAQTALDAYNASIITNFSGENAGSTGISIWLPRQWAEPPGDYGTLDPRLSAETGWDEFLRWWNRGIVSAPKISLAGAGWPIRAGSAVPSSQNGTDFGVARLGVDVVQRTFTISNSATSTLHLTGSPKVQITGDAAGDFTVTAVPPDRIDGNGTGTFTITFDPKGTHARNATVRIYNDDKPRGTFTFAISGQGDAPDLSVDKDPIVVEEGGSGTSEAVFTVTISSDPLVTTTVNYATVADTARDGVDYIGKTDTLTFEPGGPLTQTVVVPILGDTDPELDKRFYLDISGATNAGIRATQGQATGIIKDDDGTLKHFGGKDKVIFIDPQDGDTVTVSLAGPGAGTVLLDAAGNCLGIGIDGALSTSALTVAVRKALVGDGQATVRDIVIDGSMKSITAGTTNLTGNLRITGPLGSLVLNNVSGGGLLDIDIAAPSLDTGAALTMTLGRVTDISVNTHALPIRSLTAIEWVNTPASAAELITAPSLASLTIKGGGKAGPAGDFQAGLLLNGADRPDQTLGAVKIAGAVSGTEWIVTGVVGKIAITGATSDWTLDTSTSAKLTVASVASLTLGLVGANVTVDVNGAIGSLKATEWVAGTLMARSIGSLTTVGIAKTGPAGNFGPTVRLTGMTGKGVALGTAKIAGTIADSSWLIDGSAGAISVAGRTTNWILQGTGASGLGLRDVKSLTVGEATNCQVRVQDVLGALKATRWAGGYVEANCLDALSVVGNKALGVAGDFTPTELRVRGEALPLRKAALGSANIAGDVTNSLWYLNGSAGAVTVGGWVSHSDLCVAGGITSLTLGATEASDFFAGLDFTKVDPTKIDLTRQDPATTRRAASADDFIDSIDSKAKIGSLTVRGVTAIKGQDPPRFVLDSHFSSPYFGAVKLTNPGGGDAYGIYTVGNYLHVAGVTIADTLNRQSLSWRPGSGNPFPVVGSMELKVV